MINGGCAVAMTASGAVLPVGKQSCRLDLFASFSDQEKKKKAFGKACAQGPRKRMLNKNNLRFVQDNTLSVLFIHLRRH
jgi:hypothetical protein